MTFQLRWYQEEAVQSIYNYFMSHSGNPVIALPTASGKSIIPAAFIQRVLHQWPTQRFLLITHVKELIRQNADKLLAMWPEAPLGIHSAGLKNQRDTAHQIIFGGIQSMIKNAVNFGHRDIIFIDEAHLVSQEESSQYLTFLSLMKLINPNLKVIGLSATPFRMGQGYITEGGLFTHICYNMTDIDGFNKLIAEGYLAPLVPLRTKTELDITGVGFNKGEFIASQLQNAVDVAEITFAGLRELVAAGEHRRSWLIFSSGIEHAEHIAQMLQQFGIECAAVHSKQPSEFNDKAIEAFKNGTLRAVSNFGKLTTGFDNPIIDLIGDFRPTLSVPLHIQKYGRGMRISDGKTNCMVLDFARNTQRLGCVNDPIIPNKKGDKVGELPVKICEACGVYNHTKVRFCTNCGAEFSFQVKLVEKSGTEELLRNDAPIVETLDCTYAIYARKQKIGKPPYIQATYFCNMKSFREFIFPEGARYGKHLYNNWWKQRMPTEPPATTDEALKFISNFRRPVRIRVWTNKMVGGKNYPEVMAAEF